MSNAGERLSWASRVNMWLKVPKAYTSRLNAGYTRAIHATKLKNKGSLTKWWREVGRPPVPLGNQRIEWSCDCGEMLWGDFQVDNPESAANLARWLEHPDQQSHGHSTSYTPPNLTIASASQPVGPAQKSTLPTSPLSPVAPSTGIAPTSAAAIDPTVLKERYLELCINTGEYDITLAEIHITTPEASITSDGQLFEEIRKQYNKHRGFLRSHKWSLFKPVDVHFVQ
ncbi:MAG: hypothetical protein Q9170_007375, partial [Blastenia crenularia]